MKSFDIFVSRRLEYYFERRVDISEFFFILVKPLIVNITNKLNHISALRTYEIECASSGSRPEAIITWWKGTHQVKHMARNVSVIAIKSLREISDVIYIEYCFVLYELRY